MSMLSEPRRRQKWSLNPRGTLWSQDENKFGAKLMEKMGWEKGSGLGKKQDGILDPILVRQKEDNKGVGFEGHDDTWLAHQDDFQAVLAALNEAHNESSDKVEKTKEKVAEEEEVVPEEKVSLEKLSKKSKKRVHYHKFTRGKDLSNYSADDLGCILGSNSAKRKTNKSEPSTPDPEEEEEKEEAKEDEVEDSKFSVQKGSYQEYFAKKMAQLKARGKPSYCPDETVEKVEEKEEEVKEKKKKSKKRIAEEEAEVVVEENSKKSKKEKKRLKLTEEVPDQTTSEKIEDEKESVVIKSEKKSKKEKKKSKGCEVEDIKQVEEICEVGDDSEKGVIKEKKSKKEKKKSKSDTVVEDVEEVSVDSGDSVSQKKKKKSKKEKIISEGCQDKVDVEPKIEKLEEPIVVKEEVKRKSGDAAENEEPPSKKKKKSKKKKPSIPVENPLPENYPELPGFKGSNILALPGYAT